MSRLVDWLKEFDPAGCLFVVLSLAISVFVALLVGSC